MYLDRGKTNRRIQLAAISLASFTADFIIYIDIDLISMRSPGETLMCELFRFVNVH